MPRHVQYVKPRCSRCRKMLGSGHGYSLEAQERSETWIKLRCRFCGKTWRSRSKVAMRIF